MPKIEGYWDCPYCGHKAIRGRYQACPDCGKTRAADTRFYMLDTEPVADESKVGSGPDWFCPYCDSYNPASVTVCRNCGHAREATDEDYFQIRARQESRNEPPPTPVEKPSFFRRHRLLLIIALVILGIIAGRIYANRDRSVEIVGSSWERTIEVEENRLVEESDWSLPADAVERLGEKQEIHHYDRVLDHYETVTEEKSREVFDGYDTYYTYEDMGNGYFDQVEHSTPRYRTEYYTETHEEPVYVDVPRYQTKYYYTAWRWVPARTETASGQTDPYWPQLRLASNEREGQHGETYSVTYADKKGNRQTFTCDYDMFSRLQIGKSYTVKIHGGEITEIVS